MEAPQQIYQEESRDMRKEPSLRAQENEKLAKTTRTVLSQVKDLIRKAESTRLSSAEIVLKLKTILRPLCDGNIDVLSKSLVDKNSLEKLLVSLDALNDAATRGEFTADADVVNNVSSGLSLRGVLVGFDPIENAEVPRFPLLARILSVTLMGPSMPRKVEQFESISEDAVRDFCSIVEEGGMSRAAGAAINGWGLGGSLYLARDKRKRDASSGFSASKTSQGVYGEVALLPLRSFQISPHDMQLSPGAENELMNLRSLPSARKFMKKFGSHVVVGIQHVGGILTTFVVTKSREERTASELITAARKEFEMQASLQFRGFGVSLGASYSTLSARESEKSSSHDAESTQYTSAAYREFLGPACSSWDLFEKALSSSNKMWYLIDRADDNASNLLGVWEIMKHSDNSVVRDNAELVYRAWESEVRMHGNSGDSRVAELIGTQFSIDSLKPKGSDNFERTALVEEAAHEFIEFVQSRCGSNPVGVIDPIPGNEIIVELKHWLKCCPSLSFFCRIFESNVVRECLSAMASGEKEFLSDRLRPLFSPEVIVGLRQKNMHIPEEIIRLTRTEEVREGSLTSPPTSGVFLEDLADLPNKVKALADNVAAEVPSREVARVIAKSLSEAIRRNDEKGELVKSVAETYGFSWKNNEQPILANFEQEVLKAEYVRLLARKIKEALTETSSSSTKNFEEPTMPDLPDPSALRNFPPKRRCLANLIRSRPLRVLEQGPEAIVEQLRLGQDPKLLPTGAPGDEQEQDDGIWAEVKDFEEEDEVMSIAGSEDAPNVPCGKTSFYEELLNLMEGSTVAGQSQVAQLALTRRMSVPLIGPGEKNSARLAFYGEALRIVYVRNGLGDKNKVARIGLDTSMPRAAFVSEAKEKSGQLTHGVVNAVFNTTLSSSNAPCSFTDCTAELAVGFLKVRRKSQTDFNPWLVLHVMGDYHKIWSFLGTFADVIFVEADSKNLITHEVHLHNSRTPIVLWSASECPRRIPREASSGKTLRTELPLKDLIESFSRKIVIPFGRRCSTSKDRVPLVQIREQFPQIFEEESVVIDNMDDYFQGVDVSKVRILQSIFANQAKVENEVIDGLPACRWVEEKIRENEKSMKKNVKNVMGQKLVQLFLELLQEEDAERRVWSLLVFEDVLFRHQDEEVKRLESRKNALYLEKRATDGKKNFTIKNRAYQKVSREWMASVISLDSLWRELCHAYRSFNKHYETIPALAARYMQDGFTLELMDGDASRIPDRWVKDVLRCLEDALSKNRDNAPRVVVLSTVGAQSSGKSTLNNLMFGLRLSTAAGRCTRGISMALVPLIGEDRDLCRGADFALVLDTEGLRDPERSSGSESERQEANAHDNRLTAAALLPADAAIFLVDNQGTDVVKEAIPIVMRAYVGSTFAKSRGSMAKAPLVTVYTRVDTSDKPSMRSLTHDLVNQLEDARRTVEKETDGAADLNILDSVHLSEVGGSDEDPDHGNDIRFLSQYKPSVDPPNDVLHRKHGRDCYLLRRHVFDRLEKSTCWEARRLRDIASSFEALQHCIREVDWYMKFADESERLAYIDLQKSITKKSDQLSKTYCDALKTIEDVDPEHYGKGESVAHEKAFESLMHQVNQVQPQLDRDVAELLESHRYNKWKDETLKSWEYNSNRLKEHFEDTLRQKMISYFGFDSALARFKAQLKTEIHRRHEEYQRGQGKELGVDDFNRLFEETSNKALESTLPISLSVPQKIKTQYQNVLPQWGDIMARATQNTRFSIPWPFNNPPPGHQERINRLIVEVEQRIKHCTRYDPNVVSQCIKIVQRTLKLEKVRKSNWQNDTHLHVFNRVTEMMHQKQKQWDDRHNLAMLLEQSRASLYSYFQAVLSGCDKQRLLALDVSQVLEEKMTTSFFSELAGAVASHCRKSEGTRWLGDPYLRLAVLDWHLLKLLNNAKFEEVVKFASEPQTHFSSLIDAFFKHQLESFRNREWKKFTTIEESIEAAAGRAHAVLVSENTEGKGALDAFLNSLLEDSRSKLPVRLRDAVRSLSRNVYRAREAHIDFDTVAMEIKKKVKALREKGAPVLNVSECSAILKEELVRYDTCSPLCTATCPICCMPCKKAISHMLPDKHDTEHQPSGLAGMHNLINPHNLKAFTCSNADQEPGTLHLGDKIVKYHNRETFENEFCKNFPDWTAPAKSVSSKMRQYIFRNLQSVIVECFSTSQRPVTRCLPEEMPPDFSLRNDVAKEVEDRVKDLELPGYDDVILGG